MFRVGSLLCVRTSGLSSSIISAIRRFGNRIHYIKRYMKFTVQGKEFLNQLNASAKVLNSRNTIAILDNFLLNLDGDRLSITASDSENVLTSSMEVFEAEGEGQIAINAKKLLEMIKEIANQPITIEVQKDFMIKISYQNGEFKLMGVDPAPYPLPPTPAESRTLKVPAAVISRGLSMTLFAADLKANNPTMAGILWDCFDDKLVMVGTNGQKLVRYTATSFAPGMTLQFILHMKTCGVINSLISDDAEEAEIRLSDKSAVFSFGSYTFSCLFMKGRYAPYSRVIPTSNPYRIVVDRQNLLSAVKRVAISASDDSNPSSPSNTSRRIRFDFSPSSIALSAQDIDHGVSGSEKVMCDYEGPDFSIGLTADASQEVLANIPCENVVLELSGPARPMLFVPFEQKEGEDVTMLLMPFMV